MVAPFPDRCQLGQTFRCVEIHVPVFFPFLISDELDEIIDNINTVIKAATDLVVPPRQAKRSAPKLKIASSSMKEASAKTSKLSGNGRNQGNQGRKIMCFTWQSRVRSVSLEGSLLLNGMTTSKKS